MTAYIVVMAVAISISQTWAASPERMIAATLGTAVAAAIVSLPITWEFGRMYLDLWDATQTLRDLAKTDLQTGVLNHRSFAETVEAIIAEGRPIALMIGDLDRFKTINDRHGHQTGDEVIARVGAELRDLFGPGTVVGRMGGEEFAAAIDCPFETETLARTHVMTFAEELRRRIGDIEVTTASGTVRPTISLGVARSHPGQGWPALYARADTALYLAKTRGRDRVVEESEIPLVDFPRPDRQRPEFGLATVIGAAG
jgi:diguanylate cyclase (GGDEF)-like protein